MAMPTDGIEVEVVPTFGGAAQIIQPGGGGAPSGPAGGDLAGTYPTPTVATVPDTALVGGINIALANTGGKAEISTSVIRKTTGLATNLALVATTPTKVLTMSMGAGYYAISAWLTVETGAVTKAVWMWMTTTSTGATSNGSAYRAGSSVSVDAETIAIPLSFVRGFTGTHLYLFAMANNAATVLAKAGISPNTRTFATGLAYMRVA